MNMFKGETDLQYLQRRFDVLEEAHTATLRAVQVLVDIVEETTGKTFSELSMERV